MLNAVPDGFINTKLDFLRAVLYRCLGQDMIRSFYFMARYRKFLYKITRYARNTFSIVLLFFMSAHHGINIFLSTSKL